MKKLKITAWAITYKDSEILPYTGFHYYIYTDREMAEIALKKHNKNKFYRDKLTIIKVKINEM